jgi:hypothetical protein
LWGPFPKLHRIQPFDRLLLGLIADVAVTINTPQAIAMRTVGRRVPWALALLLPVFLLRRTRRKFGQAVALGLLLSAGAFALSGCGSSANGFRGVYPKSPAPDSSSNGFAAKVGGGLDLNVSHHVSVRLVEANWLRTQLPNSATNIQNDLTLGAGIVFHTTQR